MLFFHSNTDEERHTYKLYTEKGRNVACKYCRLLAQEDEDVVVKRIVVFYSPKFSKTEITYAKMEKELCAVVWCLL